MKSYVLDSYSIIAYFEKDTGYEKIIDLLSRSNNILLLMNIINWGEVYYIILREQGSDKASLFEKNFEKLPLT